MCGEMRNAQRILTDKPQDKYRMGDLGVHEDNIKSDL